VKLFPGKRSQLPVPEGALEHVSMVPLYFVDDGCSNSPDGWFGFDFSWACRIHDARYCQRTPIDGPSSPAQGTHEHREYADNWLRSDIKASLPWRWRWVGWVYWAGVRAGGGIKAYNSCFPLFPHGAGLEQARRKRCRHGMPRIDT